MRPSDFSLLNVAMWPHSGLAPEIAHFRIPSDSLGGMRNIPGDWYIKGARCGTHLFHIIEACHSPGVLYSAGESPPYDARYMLRHVPLCVCSSLSTLTISNALKRAQTGDRRIPVYRVPAHRR
jgi:hypothetical protein